MRALRLLVTGFGPFPGAPVNQSAQVVQALARVAPDWARRGFVLSTHILPVVFDVERALAPLVARERPDRILHLGVATRSRVVAIEVAARNRVSCVRPDARGRVAGAMTLGRGPARRLPHTSGAKAAVAMRRAGAPARVSVDAGAYVCNALYWAALDPGAGRGQIPTLFLHIPPARRLAPSRIAVALARAAPFLFSRSPAGGCTDGWKT